MSPATLPCKHPAHPTIVSVYTHESVSNLSCVLETLRGVARLDCICTLHPARLSPLDFRDTFNRERKKIPCFRENNSAAADIKLDRIRKLQLQTHIISKLNQLQIAELFKCRNFIITHSWFSEYPFEVSNVLDNLKSEHAITLSDFVNLINFKHRIQHLLSLNAVSTKKIGPGWGWARDRCQVKV